MDPIDVREERVTTGTGAAPAEGAPPVERAATPAPAAPVSAAAPGATGTSVYSSRTTAYPVAYRSIQLVWLIAGVVDIILALHFIFRAAAANNTGFAHYVFRIGGWLAAPFEGIFNTTGNGTIRWADVLAVVIYSIAAWIVTKVVRITAAPRKGTA